MKELVQIQARLKAPKSETAGKGRHFDFRSAESILEAVKPILAELDCVIIMTDAVKLIGERYYIEATARVINKDGEVQEATALAREENTSNGMNPAQTTGAASSYARKYALGGLLAIDNNKDADTDEYMEARTAQPQGRAPQEMPPQEESKEEMVDRIKAREEAKARELWKKKVIEVAAGLNIGVKELAKDYKLTKETTVEEFQRIYDDLTSNK